MKIKIMVAIFVLSIFKINYAKVLGKLDLPENWEIKDVKIIKNYKINNLVVPKFIKQVIDKKDEKILVSYYIFSNTDDLMNLFLETLRSKKSFYIDLKDKTGYIIDASPVARKNVLRFLRLSLLEQIKVVYEDIENKNINAVIIKERNLSQEEMGNFAKEYGITITQAKEQVFELKKGIGLSVIFFLCKDRKNAQLGYKNARLKNSSELISFLFCQNFLVRLSWIKI